MIKGIIYLLNLINRGDGILIFAASVLLRPVYGVFSHLASRNILAASALS